MNVCYNMFYILVLKPDFNLIINNDNNLNNSLTIYLPNHLNSKFKHFRVFFLIIIIK